MASQLTYSFSELRIEAAYKAGWGTDESLWGTAKEERLLSMVNSGYRFFLFPPQSGEGGPHTWSWLIYGGQRPHVLPGGEVSDFTYVDEQLAQLTASMGIDEYPLPEDFGGIAGELTFRQIEPGGGGYGVTSPTEHAKRLTIINDSEMRTMQASAVQNFGGGEDLGNGPPQYASYRLGRMDFHDHITIQPYRLILFPKPDNAYQLHFQYFSMPQSLLGTLGAAEIPLCPPQHAETLKAAVLGAVELMLDDRRGEYWERFLLLLAQSIAYDKLILGKSGEAFPVEGLLRSLDQDWMQIAIQMGLRHGFPPNPRSWTHTQQQTVYYELQSGYRQVLVAHNWKFTKPLAIIRLVAGTNRYDLPSDFDQIIGELNYMAADHLVSAFED